MFTIKYQSFNPSPAQPIDGPKNYDRCEQLHGPFDLVSQEMKDGQMVVHAHRGEEALGMTFGPAWLGDTAGEITPRPTVWVMNEHGATVATYRL